MRWDVRFYWSRSVCMTPAKICFSLQAKRLGNFFPLFLFSLPPFFFIFFFAYLIHSSIATSIYLTQFFADHNSGKGVHASWIRGQMARIFHGTDTFGMQILTWQVKCAFGFCKVFVPLSAVARLVHQTGCNVRFLPWLGALCFQLSFYNLQSKTKRDRLSTHSNMHISFSRVLTSLVLGVTYTTTLQTSPSTTFPASFLTLMHIIVPPCPLLPQVWKTRISTLKI